ncbi:hypothetical protein RZE82_05355 [Mollicutes bacterium LVI A0039]|nr:hypothetical protein RZE82_05355 [Mollicutes bacterium LVI A0039]
MSTQKSKTLIFGEKEFEQLIAKLKKSDINLNLDFLTQFCFDIFSGNYKLKKQNVAKFAGSIALVFLPVEQISLSFPPPFFLLGFALRSLLDEALALKLISDCIKDETKNYKKFIKTDDYTPSEFSNPFENFNMKQSLLELQNFILLERNVNKSRYVTNGLVIYEVSKQLSDYIYYNDKDYENLICEYLFREETITNRDIIKIPNAKKISKLLAFPIGFQEDDCLSVLQNDLNNTFENVGLHEYKLNVPAIISPSYFLSSEDSKTYIANDNIKYNDLEATRLYDLTDISFNLNLLLIIAGEISMLNNPAIQSIIFKLHNMDVEINIYLNYQVQVISHEASWFDVAKQLEIQLKMFMKKNKSSKLINIALPKLRKLELNDIDINQQIKIALNRLHIISENKNEATIKHDELYNLIPLFNKKNREEYLLSAQKQNNTIVDNKKVYIKFDSSPFLNDPFKHLNITTSSSIIMLNSKVSGCMTANHLLNILETLFLVQCYACGFGTLDMIALIDCSDDLFIQANLTDNSVRIIDAKAILNFQEEEYLEQIISKELKSNLSLIKKYQ